MRFKLTTRRLFLFILSALFLFGCSLVNRFEGGDIAQNYDLDPSTSVTISAGEPLTLDPALTHAGASGALGHIFSGLVTLTPDLQVEPDLAAGWTVSEDRTVFTFFLRKNALFHDGRPVTADDVIYSWERATDPALHSDTASTYLGDIVGVADKLAGNASTISGLRAIDDHTLEVTIDEPKVYFLAKLTYPVAFVVDQENVTDRNWERTPNGTGPFILKEWTSNEVIILEKFAGFYRETGNVLHIIYSIGQGIPLSLYETDQIDLVGIGGGTLARASNPSDPLSSDLQTGVSMCTTTIGFDTTQPPFDDVRVRQAFSYAINRETIVSSLYDDNALVAKGSLPPGIPGYTGLTNAPIPGYSHNPERARALLAEAGYADPASFPAVTFTTSGYDDVSGLVSAAVTMWQDALGITVTATLLDPFVYYDELYAGNTGHLFSSGWCADYPDPENFLDVLYGTGSAQNIGSYSNPSIDAMLQEARSEGDVQRRMVLYAAIEAALVEDAPVVFISHGKSAILVKPRIEGYILSPIGVPQWQRVQLVGNE